MLESEMVKIGIDFFKKTYPCVQNEVPFLSRCIDVVLCTADKKLISIEFKVNNWRHAIEQAKNHKLGADMSYVCLPERKLSEDLLNAISEAELGLMFFNPSSDVPIFEVIPAPHKSKNVPAFRDMLMKNTVKISNL